MEQWSTETEVLPKIEPEPKVNKKGRHSATSSMAMSMSAHAGWDFGSEQDSEAETYVLSEVSLMIVPIRATSLLELNRLPFELLRGVLAVLEMVRCMMVLASLDRRGVKTPIIPIILPVSLMMDHITLFPVPKQHRNNRKRGVEWPSEWLWVYLLTTFLWIRLPLNPPKSVLSSRFSDGR